MNFEQNAKDLARVRDELYKALEKLNAKMIMRDKALMQIANHNLSDIEADPNLAAKLINIARQELLRTPTDEEQSFVLDHISSIKEKTA